jgi:hypothetical protein
VLYGQRKSPPNVSSQFRMTTRYWLKSNPAKSPGVNTVQVCPAAVMASFSTVKPHGSCVSKIASSFGALTLEEKV